MQMRDLVQIANARWAGLFGGISGFFAAVIVMTLPVSQPQEALLVGLLAGGFSLLLIVLANLTGILPADRHGDEAVSDN